METPGNACGFPISYTLSRKTCIGMPGYKSAIVGDILLVHFLEVNGSKDMVGTMLQSVFLKKGKFLVEDLLHWANRKGIAMGVLAFMLQQCMLNFMACMALGVRL